MFHRLALSTIVAASFLFVDRPAHADGDVPPDPEVCPALFADLCAAPGICSAECVSLCDGVDSTDASLACKVCIGTSAQADADTCAAAMAPAPPTCQDEMPGTLPCVGSEVEAGCFGDGACDDEAAPACYACDPGGGARCVTYCGA